MNIATHPLKIMGSLAGVPEADVRRVSHLSAIAIGLNGLKAQPCKSEEIALMLEQFEHMIHQLRLMYAGPGTSIDRNPPPDFKSPANH